MWRKLIFAIFFTAIDCGSLGAIYSLLPDTQSLNTAKHIQRSNTKGEPHAVEIKPGSKSYVRYKDIPESLRYAVVVLEDGKFFEHRGFDLKQIWIAISETATEGKRLRGASTITQQLAKNLYLSSERSFIRKLIEALITIKIEINVPKWKILELYFNSIDWGKNLIGIKSASQYYFKKDPQELSVKESVYLAAIIPNPAIFGDEWDKVFVRKQILRALERLYRGGIIDIDEYRRAIVEHFEE